MGERTYHGQPVQVICDTEVIEMPDAGVPRCCPLCTFYQLDNDGSANAARCIVPSKEQERTRLMCGAHNSFYVKANDNAVLEYQHLAVLARLNGGKFTNLEEPED